MYCDLHMHSTASDGSDAPEALPALARAAGVAAIALTDHDTTAGLPACEAAAREAGIEFVPGIEISADPALPKTSKTAPDAPRRGTLHILGLFVRHDDPRLAEIETRMRTARNDRNPAIVARLQELGVQLEYKDVLQLAAAQGTTIIGRPHIAQALMARGYVKSIQDAFARYLAAGKPAYVRRDRMPAADAIDAIHHAGGLAIAAHPIQLALTEPGELEYLLSRLREIGLDGMEVRHCDHSPALVREYEAMAAKLNLLTSGGSDYHGQRKAVDIGSQRVPLAVCERLRSRAGELQTHAQAR